MKQMTLIEMDGFLKGKCIPRDLKVNETNAEYLVRKFAEAEAKCAALAAEVEAVKSAHQDAVNTIMYTANRTGVLYTEKAIQMSCKTPATDAFLAEVRAQGVDMAACALDDVNQFNYANMLDDLAQKIRKGVQS